MVEVAERQMAAQASYPQSQQFLKVLILSPLMVVKVAVTSVGPPWQYCSESHFWSPSLKLAPESFPTTFNYSVVSIKSVSV